jgi:asparagine N-glycosylation enzyme membrane subunit Stt3
MLVTIAIILLVLWFLGVIGTYTIGWFVHLLLVAAIILFLIRIIQGRNPVR